MNDKKQETKSPVSPPAAGTAEQLDVQELAQVTGGSLADFAGNAARDVTNAVAEAIRKSGKTGGQ